MLVCPECGRPLPGAWEAQHCSCGWRRGLREGIPEYLSDRDRRSPILGQYLANYEVIAADDLAASIQDETYLRIQSERLFSYLGPLAGRSVLELGIGQGRLFERIRAEGPAQLVGIDIVAGYLGRQRPDETTRVVIANAENLPFAEEFDLIVASDVFEHVLNIGDCVLSARRALRPGGRLVVRVPYRESLIQYASQIDGRYEMVHLRDFNRENLGRLLRTGGFEVESFKLDGFHPSIRRPYLDRSGFLRRRFERWVARRFGSEAEVAAIDPRLGRLVMKPIEVTAVALKPGGEP